MMVLEEIFLCTLNISFAGAWRVLFGEDDISILIEALLSDLLN